MAKRSVKQKSTQTAASAQQDIVGLITMLIEKLVVLEAKIDNVLSRVSARPSEAPRQHMAPAAVVVQSNNRRLMHRAICADCGKNCEVPFKPSANRPVYCKDCFTVRKKKGTFLTRPSEAPKAMPAVEAAKPAIKKKKPAKKPAKKKR